MKITQYNPVNGAELADQVTGINFGAMQPGSHSTNAIVIKPVVTTESSFTELKLFLQSKGGFTSTQFGYFLNSTFVSGLVGGSAQISGHFTVNSNPSLTGAGAVNFTAGTPEYAWLDVQAGLNENGFTTQARYIFVFDFT